MKPVLLVRNDPDETFGVAPGALAWGGLDLLTVNMTLAGAQLPEPPDVAGVVMFGANANVDETDRFPYLGRVRRYALEVVEARVPYLGICLGAQLLARALDRPVVPAPVREVGFEPIRPSEAAAHDPLLSLYADGDLVIQWHEDTFDLPDGAVLLATGDRIATQAFRLGHLAWGIQFHQEVDAEEYRLWVDAAEQGDVLPGAWGKSAGELRMESALHMAAHEERGRELFRRFADVVHDAQAVET